METEEGRNMTRLEVQTQACFCMKLMDKLFEQISNANVSYGMLDKHYRMKADITRLRRELLDLSAMLCEVIREE